jgi:hypothetical protein
LASGTRIDSTISAPPRAMRPLNATSASRPGAYSLTMVTIFLAPFFTAQSAMIADDCGADKIRRTLHRGGGARHQHDRRYPALGGERRDRQRGWRDADPENANLLVDDQILGEALCRVRRRRIVLDDELDLAAGDGVAVLLQVDLGTVDRGLSGGVEGARHRPDQAELEDLLGRRRTRQGGERHEARERGGGTRPGLQHGVPSPMLA